MNKATKDLKSSKCDVIILTNGDKEWIKLCVYALIKNTLPEQLGKVYLIANQNPSEKLEVIYHLKQKYPDILEVIESDHLNYSKSINMGLEVAQSDYILVLTGETIVTKNLVKKLMNHFEKNNVGCISPISNNASHLSLPLYYGFSFQQMNNMLEMKFSGKTFDALSLDSRCFMIKKSVVSTMGLFDEKHVGNYSELLGYQYQMAEKGIESLIALDTYVFHKESVESIKLLNKKESQHNTIQGKWENAFEAKQNIYCRNHPIEYIKKHLLEKDLKINVDTLFYVPTVVQNSGGCHVLFDMVNYLLINGLNSNIVYDNFSNYKEIVLFYPISMNDISKVKVGKIVSTIWNSTFKAKKIAMDKKIPLISFVQGYEEYFDNGNNYGLVEITHKLPDHILTISNYLKTKMKNVFGVDSTEIPNGVHLDLLSHQSAQKEVKTITISLRNNVMKGDFLLLELIKLIGGRYHNLVVNVIHINDAIIFPIIKHQDIRINRIEGPLSRSEIGSILKHTDIFIDASLNEGFGLMPLEAMAAGAVPIVSNSFGVLEYMEDGKNGYIINEVNDVDKYMEKLDLLVNQCTTFQKMKKQAALTASKFDYDNAVEEYIKYFSEKNREVVRTDYLTKEEEELANLLMYSREKGNMQKVLYSLAKKMPKRLKKKIKKIVTILYKLYN